MTAPSPVAAVTPRYAAGAVRESDGDAAARGLWLWDVFFAAAAVITAGMVVAGSAPPVSRAVAATIVLGLGAAWFVLARRTLDTPEPVAAGYVTGLVAALVTAALLAPEATWALWVVLPMAFWLLRLSWAIAVTMVLSLGLPVLASLASGDPLADAVGGLFPQGVFMAAFGLLVGIWIHRVTDESAERARLIEQLESSRAEVEQLSHRAGAAAERERLAGEIHDTLAQGFTSIVTLLQAAQAELDTEPDAARRHLELAVRSARENLAEARTLVAASAPSALAAHTLPDAIGRLAARVAEEYGLGITAEVAGGPRRLPAEHEVVLLRAAQELLANIGRHASARCVTVKLDFSDTGGVELSVTDDGGGFDPAVAGSGSYGLAMLRGRVERLGGEVDIDSAPGVGTTAVVALPDRAGAG